jgi:hypothetical protein
MSALHPPRRSNRLVAVRLPTRREKRARAEIVFERLHNGRTEAICAARCYEGWQQWGANRDALSANVELVERWRRGDILGFEPKEDPS